MTVYMLCEATMILKPGNLVRHKSGGPIMLVDDLISPEQFRESSFILDAPHDCTWLENGIKKIGSFSTLRIAMRVRGWNAQKLR
jgi:uncharacterized protein YodC (DUF2158 family)